MAIVQQGDFTFAFPTLVLRRKLQETEDMNAGLRELIVAERNSKPGLTRSNVGAWHSDLDFFRQAAEPLLQLKQRLRSCIEEYWRLDQQVKAAEPARVLMTGWAMVYEAGHYASPHNHPNSNYSGVYWVDDGTSSDDAAASDNAAPQGNAAPEGNAALQRDAEADAAPQARRGSEPARAPRQAGMLTLLDPRAGSGMFATAGVQQPNSLGIDAESGKLVLFPSGLLHYVHPHQGARPRIAVSFNVQVHRE